MIEQVAQQRLSIWDAPTRLFHWALVILIAAMWWTGEERMLDWHRLAGYSLIALLLFRLAWGFVGSTTARFGSFVRAPGAVFGYVRNDMFRKGGAPHAGHNPLGGWSVIVMLLLLLAQSVLGLFSVDEDGLESGPFSYLVEFDTGRVAAGLHHLLFDGLVIIIALHVAAVAFYLLWRRENLIGPMVSGRRRWTGQLPQLAAAPLWRALLIVAACGILVWAVVTQYGRV